MILVVWGTVLLLGFLTLPSYFRDPLLLGLAFLCFAISLVHFEAVWSVFLMALPVLWLIVSMFDQPKITGNRVILLALLLAFFLRAKPAGFWRSLSRHLFFSGFLLFVLANVISGFAAGQIESVFRGVSYIEPLLFFVLSYYFVRLHPANLARTLWIITTGGLVIGALGLVELVVQRPLVEILGIEDMTSKIDLLQFYFSENRFGLGGRISSTLLQPVYAGAYFCFCLIVMVYCFGILKPQHRKWLAVLVPLEIVLILATGSRGPILALLPAGLMFVALSQPRGRAFFIAAAGLGLIVFGITFVVPGVASYLAESLDPASSASANTLGRFDLTVALFGFFKDKPLFGQGPGLIQRLAQAGVGGFEGLGGQENQYAQILADGGLLAGAAYALFAGGVISFALRLYRSKIPEIRNNGILLIVLLTYYFTLVISVTVLMDVTHFLIMCILGGIAAFYDDTCRDSRHGITST